MWNGAVSSSSVRCPTYPALLCHFLLDFGVCASALPAADLDLLLVRPSRMVEDAALAADFDVWRFGVPVWDSALPPADFDLELVERLVSVLDAAREADLPVVLRFAMMIHQCVAKKFVCLVERGPKLL